MTCWISKGVQWNIGYWMPLGLGLVYALNWEFWLNRFFGNLDSPAFPLASLKTNQMEWKGFEVALQGIQQQLGPPSPLSEMPLSFVYSNYNYLLQALTGCFKTFFLMRSGPSAWKGTSVFQWFKLLALCLLGGLWSGCLTTLSHCVWWEFVCVCVLFFLVVIWLAARGILHILFSPGEAFCPLFSPKVKRALPDQPIQVGLLQHRLAVCCWGRKNQQITR